VAPRAGVRRTDELAPEVRARGVLGRAARAAVARGRVGDRARAVEAHGDGVVELAVLLQEACAARQRACACARGAAGPLKSERFAHVAAVTFTRCGAVLGAWSARTADVYPAGAIASSGERVR
jgi:hypothetical protein